MVGENLKKWEPVSGLPKKLYLSELRDNKEGLLLKLVDETDFHVLTVKFDSALSFRATDEGNRLKFLNEISGQQEWSLYMIIGSQYLAWFNEQCYSIYEIDHIKHYLFFTPDDIVDVLSINEPIVDFS